MAKQSDRDKDRQKACQIDAFLEKLRRYASAFRWFVDAHCGLRAEHPEAKFLLCPISAVYFATTGKAVRSSQIFAIADGEMELRFASLDIAVAADERLDQGLGKAMKLAVGIKAAA